MFKLDLSVKYLIMLSADYTILQHPVALCRSGLLVTFSVYVQLRLLFMLLLADTHVSYKVGLTRQLLLLWVPFLGWYCAATMHMLSFMVLLVELFSCSSVRQF
jgi:hypothetical protein